MEKQCEECGLMNTEGCNTCGVLNPVMKITVMPPTVVNVNNVPKEDTSQNVASFGITELNEKVPEFAKEHLNEYPGETKIDDVNLDYQREDGK